MGDAEQILRARIAAISGGAQIGQRADPLAALKQQQAVIVRGLKMPLRRRLAKQRFGLGQVLFDAFAQLVGLAQIEQRIGIARGRLRLPLLDRSGIVTPRPGIDPSLGVGHGRGGKNYARAQNQHGNQRFAAHRKNPVPVPAG